jgi:hypothetical protein
MVEVYLFYFVESLILLGLSFLLELLIGHEGRTIVSLLPRCLPIVFGVLRLYFFYHFLYFQVVVIFLHMILYEFREVLPFSVHLFSQLEHSFLIRAVGVFITGGVAILFRYVPVAFFEVLDLHT